MRRRDFLKGSLAAAGFVGHKSRLFGHKYRLGDHLATKQAIPAPEGWLITRWAADPLAFGSYSFLAPGATPDDRVTLAAPVDGRLFFAGEATSVDYPATVHGAYLSGRRAATEVAAEASAGAPVIVAGAGMAGLAAARSLADDGYEVTVVEGRDRVGGRIWTDRSLGVPLDLGASWIHGSKGNPMTELAREVGVATAATDYDNSIAYDGDGRRVTGRTENAYWTALYDVLSDAAALGEELDVDTTLQTGIDMVVGEQELDPDQRVGVDYALNVEIEHDYAADAAELSLWWWDEGASVDGPDLVFPRAGYGKLVRHLAKGLDVRTSHAVSRIDHGDGVTVVTNEGAVNGAHAVITLPLGVLQAGTVTFAPALPAEKQAAISRLGMGLLDKVYLRFPEVFWDDDVEFIGRIGPKGEWAEWLNVAYYTGDPVLLAFNSGSFARALEPQSDEQVVAAALDVLARIYG